MFSNGLSIYLNLIALSTVDIFPLKLGFCTVPVIFKSPWTLPIDHSTNGVKDGNIFKSVFSK